MTHASLFSGIGGPEVAAAALGWENIFHCEINPFGRRVLEYWFPNSDSYEDIKKSSFTKYRGQVDVLTGGFPCQPFSYAGQRGGAEDDRYLWPEFKRVISEVQPSWVIGENVPGIATMVEQGEVVKVASEATLFAEEDGVSYYRRTEQYTIERVCRDLEELGYSVQPLPIPACAVGAPHRRDRIFIIGCRNGAASDSDNHTDGRVTRKDESESGEERLQERDEVRQSDEPNKIRPASAAVSKDSMRSGFLHGQDEKQGSFGNIGDTCARSDQRICSCTSGTFADSRSGRQPTPREQDNRERETVQRESRVQPLNGVERPCASSAAPDPQSNGRMSENSAQCCGVGSQIFGDKERDKVHDGLDRPCSAESATDSYRSRGDELHKHLEPQLTDGAEPFSNGRERDASDTFGEGLQRNGGEKLQSNKGVERNKKHVARSCSNDTSETAGWGRWEKFPSVSPIHRGNDGISFDVGGLSISFPKWRTESLKAYGNAIVPQVVYELMRYIMIIEEGERV